MRLRRRLFFFGAVVPSFVLGIGFVATGFLLHHHLVDATDRALLTQAAVESVSLFDAGDGAPHLHLSRSPLTGHVEGFAPEGALYDARGELYVAFPTRGLAPARMSLEGVGADPELRSIELDGRKMRELRVAVRSPDGERYLLWLGVGTETVDQTMLFFGRATTLVVLASALLFFFVARRESASLHARLSRLSLHVDRLREGHFDPPPPDPVDDVVGSLRASIAEATERLRIAHATEARLVADAAHELRTPLSAMRAVIDTTLRRERPAAELRESLESTRAEAERLSLLVGEMLDLATVQQTSFARELASPESIVREAVFGIRPLAEERGVTLSVELESCPESFRAVSSQVRRALEN
ncbi:MAG: HAMP domain-containing histidine kinase, partial [Polyangiaceae bacterium]|nr:HAMP domain-containing histidine kinase [Polyangiaceae bacterium]